MFPRTQAGAPLCDFLLVGDVNGCGTHARPAREALSFGRVDYVIRGAHAYRGVHACVTGRSYRRYLNESLNSCTAQPILIVISWLKYQEYNLNSKCIVSECRNSCEAEGEVTFEEVL